MFVWISFQEEHHAYSNKRKISCKIPQESNSPWTVPKFVVTKLPREPLSKKMSPFREQQDSLSCLAVSGRTRLAPYTPTIANRLSFSESLKAKFLCCCEKKKKQTEPIWWKKSLFCLHTWPQSIIKGSQCRNLGPGTDKEAMDNALYCLAPHGLLSLLFTQPTLSLSLLHPSSHSLCICLCAFV